MSVAAFAGATPNLGRPIGGTREEVFRAKTRSRVECQNSDSAKLNRHPQSANMANSYPGMPDREPVRQAGGNIGPRGRKTSGLRGKAKRGGTFVESQ